MKNKVKVFGIIATVLIFILSATSCSGKSGGGKSLNSAEELLKYLNSQPSNSPDKPIKVSMGANDLMIREISEVLDRAGKYVSLNLTGNALTKIPAGAGAFQECKTLVSITIPKSVTYIGPYAFGYCYNLTSVTFEGTITSNNLYEEAFGSTDYRDSSIGDLREKYLAGGVGTYTRPTTGWRGTWTKQ